MKDEVADRVLSSWALQLHRHLSLTPKAAGAECLPGLCEQSRPGGSGLGTHFLIFPSPSLLFLKQHLSMILWQDWN